VSEYKPGDAVWFIYESVRVGHVLDDVEVNALNAGGVTRLRELGDRGYLTNIYKRISAVEREKGELHFFPDCQGRNLAHLSWSVTHTTCRKCLQKRAEDLRGWRWNVPHNAEEVAYLKKVLGPEISKMESKPALDENTPYAKKMREKYG
jgi:hypothetical protein